MDSVGEWNCVVIGANDDACVCRCLLVQADKMTAIECQHPTFQRCRKGENFSVTSTLLARFLHGQDIVSKGPKVFHCAVVEVLIRVEVGHDRSGFFVQSDFGVDFLGVLIIVFERRLQVGQ